MKRMAVMCSVVAFFCTLAFAASPHFKPKDPQFLEQGLTLLMTGSLAGLSNTDLVVVLTATGVPTVLCTNRGGGSAPGQNPGETTVSGSAAIPASSVQNGQVFISLSTQPPPKPDSAVSCPNKQWDATITSMNFESATVLVIQNNVVVIEETFDL